MSAAPPTPSPSHSTKVTIDNTNRDCDGVAQSDHGSGSGTGSAVFNTPRTNRPEHTSSGEAPNKVTADLTLTNAAPNSSYGVRLIQTFASGSTQDCGSFQGPYEDAWTTDASGNGSVSLEEPLLTDSNGSGALANDAFVVLNNTTSPGTDFYTSPDVTLPTGS